MVALVIAAGSPRRTRLEARPAGRAPARPWRDEPRAPPRHRSGGMAGARAMAKALAQASGLPVVLAPSLCGAPGGWGNELLMTGLERLNVLSTPALYRPEVALEDHPVEHGQAAHHALTMDGLDARHGTPPAPTPVDVWSRLVEDGRGGQHRVGRDGSPSPAVDCGRRHLTPTRRQRTNGHLCAGVADRTSREQGPAARCSSRRWTGRRPPRDAVSWRPVRQDPWSASVHRWLGPGEVQMRAGTETIELGERVSRALTMENSGPRRRRIWWIVSSAVLAASSGPQNGGGDLGTGPDFGVDRQGRGPGALPLGRDRGRRPPIRRQEPPRPHPHR